MRTKTIFIIALTVLITIFLMTNTDAVNFNFLFTQKPVSKLTVIGICFAIGFILGYIAGKPKTTLSTYDREADSGQDAQTKETKGLSDEDREYIS